MADRFSPQVVDSLFPSRGVNRKIAEFERQRRIAPVKPDHHLSIFIEAAIRRRRAVECNVTNDFLRQGAGNDANSLSRRHLPDQLGRIIYIFYWVILPIDSPIQGNDPCRILRTKQPYSPHLHLIVPFRGR